MSDPPPGGTARDAAWLVLRAQAGDRPALEELLRHAQQLLRPYTLAMIRDAERARDVLQDVLLIIYRKLHTLREPRAFGAWARRIATREILRRLRDFSDLVEFVDEIPDRPAEQERDRSGFDDLIDRLPQLLAGVSPASRAVLVMHYLEGLSIEETAAVLDISTGTAKSRLAYGLKSLRRGFSSSS